MKFAFALTLAIVCSTFAAIAKAEDTMVKITYEFFESGGRCTDQSGFQFYINGGFNVEDKNAYQYDYFSLDDIPYNETQCFAICDDFPRGIRGFSIGGQTGNNWCSCHFDNGTMPTPEEFEDEFPSLINVVHFNDNGTASGEDLAGGFQTEYSCYKIIVERGEIFGDPHFRTWHDEHFEFHGQCDMLMTKVTDFANQVGLDLEIQIRTKMVRFWSYIKSVVIRIGDDVLELEGSALEGVDKDIHYWFNYEYQGEIEDIAGYPVTMFSEGTKNNKNRIEIDLSKHFPDQKIVFKTYKEFVGVKVLGSTKESFGNSIGILGNYNTGKTVARDGETVLDDFTKLGQEWQVLPSDGKLFREFSHPQFPEKCLLPEDPQGQRIRRLGESTVTEEAAEAACAGLKDEFDRKGCIYDILATQDLDMVGAY